MAAAYKVLGRMPKGICGRSAASEAAGAHAKVLGGILGDNKRNECGARV